MYVFQGLICVFVTSKLAAIARQGSPPSMTYHFLHLGLGPRTVGAGGMGYAVPSITVVVGGSPVVGVDVVGVDVGPTVVPVGVASRTALARELILIAMEAAKFTLTHASAIILLIGLHTNLC